MIQAGIVDPTKVTRSALQNAASVASMVLTTDALVADKKEDAAAANAAAAASMGGHGRRNVLKNPRLRAFSKAHPCAGGTFRTARFFICRLRVSFRPPACIYG